MAKSRFKLCKVCGKEFRLYARKGRKEQECCSKKCSGVLAQKRVTLNCKNCGVSFIVAESHLRNRKHTGNFCSIKCTHEAFKKGTFIYNRKKGKNRGRYTNSQGYVMVHEDGKRKCEHRVVMEQMLGRPLERYETVHHINGDRADNRLSNLQIWVGRHPSGTSTNHYKEEIDGLLKRISELEKEIRRLKGESYV